MQKGPKNEVFDQFLVFGLYDRPDIAYSSKDNLGGIYGHYKENL